MQSYNCLLICNVCTTFCKMRNFSTYELLCYVRTYCLTYLCVMCMIKEVKEELFYSQRTMGKKCMSLSMKMEISIRMLAHESMKKKFLR